ncbi:MAG: hypothetical protein ACREFZ_03295 [Acetobacteraceae bacterium]
MRNSVSLGLVAAGILGLGSIAAHPALAATVSVPLAGFVGQTPSSVAGCPYIVWRLANSSNGRVHGIAYYSDLSGLSNVTGTMDKDGTFKLALTRTSIGNGPVGTVTGTASSSGHIVAKLVGEGCANNEVNIVPMKNLNRLVNRKGG